MNQSCNWPMGNGQVLSFGIYGLNTNWNDVSGLYIFSYQALNGWQALYVGQTDSFGNRLPNHERRAEAIRKGATHIHALAVPRAGDRDQYEKRLIQHLQPPMNSQLR